MKKETAIYLERHGKPRREAILISKSLYEEINT